MQKSPTTALWSFLFACLLPLASHALAVEKQVLQGKLVITGSSTVAPLALELGKRFEKENPGTRIDIQSGGSSRGVTDVRQGVAEIGMVSRALNPDERDLKAYPLAMDGVSIIVHKSNPLQTLSDEDIVKIYTGKINNWKQLGGKDVPITVVNKAEGRSTLELFEKYFKVKNSEIKAQVIIGDNEQGIKTVAGNPDAIGYVSIGTAAFSAQQGVPVKLLPLQGVEASEEAVRKGNYPLARPLNFVVKGSPSALSKRFLDFAQSAGVRDLVQEQHFVAIAKK